MCDKVGGSSCQKVPLEKENIGATSYACICQMVTYELFITVVSNNELQYLNNQKFRFKHWLCDPGDLCYGIKKDHGRIIKVCPSR